LSAGVVLHVLIIHTIHVLTGLQTGLVLNPLKDDLLVVLYNLVHSHKTEGINPPIYTNCWKSASYGRRG
jgi:hypothetical protein